MENADEHLCMIQLLEEKAFIFIRKRQFKDMEFKG